MKTKDASARETVTVQEITDAPVRERKGALAEAVDWYLGINGKEVRHDRARPLFMAAAQREDPLARMWLARCYHKGRVGFQKDEAEAKRLAQENVGRLRELAEDGLPEAMFLLGAAYADGLGFPEDDEAAAQWYRKAADRQHALAMNNLGWAYDYGNGVQQNLDEAVAWYEKAVEFGFTPATNNLAWLYENGRGVEKDPEKAAYWYRKGAEGGNPLSMVHLADLYQRGEGVPKDEHLAGFWFAEAADRGDAAASASLKEYTQGKDGQWRKAGSDGGDRREEAGAATCFIATAAYGSSAQKHVLTLRLFREKWLNTNPPGRWLVEKYYRFSPPVAQKISKNKTLKGITRIVLTPAAVMAGAFLGKPADLAIILCGLLSITVVFLHRRRRSRRYVI